MASLTFKAFLQDYLEDLSRFHTTDIERLTIEAATANARLKAPLFLYVTLLNRQADFDLIIERNGYQSFYQDLPKGYDASTLLPALAEGILPWAYDEIWRMYTFQKSFERPRDKRKDQMRNQILSLQKETAISTETMCQDTATEECAVNPWLRKAASNKIDMPSADKLLRYMETAADCPERFRSVKRKPTTAEAEG